MNEAKIKFEDVQYKGDDTLISLVKLSGKKIVDITGYISTEFGDPVFALCNIILEDEEDLWCEGEHDLPYLTNYPEAMGEAIDELAKVDGEEDEDDN
jgi:hypothetical protein